jgi:cytochrome P450
MHVPELKGAALLGQLGDFRSNRLQLLRRVAEECGDLAWIRLGPLRTLVVSSPDLAREILTQRHDEFIRAPLQGMDGIRRLFGGGMLLSEGEQHRKQRQRTTRVLSRQRMVELAQDVVAETEAWSSCWEVGSTIDLYDELMGLSIHIAQRTLFGRRLAEDKTLANLLRAAIDYTMAEVSRAIPLPGWIPTPHNVGFRRVVAKLDALLLDVIDSRRRSPNLGDDALSLLLFSGEAEPPTDQELRDDIVALFVAGHEAMATALFWSLYHCTTDADLGARLRQCVEASIGSRSPQVEDLARLSLAVNVFKESMRLYPANHIILRRTGRALTLGGADIPARTLVLINGYEIQRDGRRFDAPDRFVPERFERMSERELAGIYLPFGAGPRTCVGNHFAMIQGVLSLVSLAQRVALEPLEAAAPFVGTGFALYPRDGWRARVQKLH